MVDFKIVAQIDSSRRSARCGRLQTNPSAPAIETPAVVHYTRQGCIPHIVDASHSLFPNQSVPLSIAFEHFVDLCIPRSLQRQKQHPSTQPILNSNAEANSELPKSLIEYLGIDRSSHVVVMAPFDIDRLFPSTTSPHRWIPTTPNAIGIISNGNVECKITSDMFVKIVSSMNPDFAVCLADPGAVLFDASEPESNSVDNPPTELTSSANQESAHSKKKKQKPPTSLKSVRKRTDRNLSFLTNVLESSSSIPIFAQLCGELDVKERRHFSTQVIQTCQRDSQDNDDENDAKKQQDSSLITSKIAGVAMYAPSANHGTSVVSSCIAASLDPIPAALPSIVYGLSTLPDIACAIHSGVDMIDDYWAYRVTMMGMALIVSVKDPVNPSDHGLDHITIHDETSHRDGVDRPVKRKRQETETQEPKSEPSFVVRAHPHVLMVKFVADGMPTRSRSSHRLDTTTSSSSSSSMGTTSLDDSEPPATMPTTSSPWRTDTRPISLACTCPICHTPTTPSSTPPTHHTRAYIHHLFTVQDMLPYALLMHHNVHQINKMVMDIRECIRDGSFERIMNKIIV